MPWAAGRGRGLLGLGEQNCVRAGALLASMGFLREQPPGWFYMDSKQHRAAAGSVCPLPVPALGSGAERGEQPPAPWAASLLEISESRRMLLS